MEFCCFSDKYVMNLSRAISRDLLRKHRIYSFANFRKGLGEDLESPRRSLKSLPIFWILNRVVRLKLETFKINAFLQIVLFIRDSNPV